MIPLDKDLQLPKGNLDEYYEITGRVLNYIPNVISNFEEKNGYIIYSSRIAGTTKYTRPVNKNLFINNQDTFASYFNEFGNVLKKIRRHSDTSDKEREIIDKSIYTIQQSIGIGFDLLANPNSSRKHVGNRFEELIRIVFTEIGIANKKIVLQIPYETDEGTKIYKCENDLIISPYTEVKSTTSFIDKNEVVISVKTTSKDRMGKIFIDKMLLERFIKHPQKVIGIFLNDVQRKEKDNIGFTLVSGLFMVYTNFLTELEGIYYIDPPPNASKKPYSKYMKRFSELITDDLKVLLTS